MRVRLVTTLDPEVKKKLKLLALHAEKDMNEVLSEMIEDAYTKLEVE